MSIKSCIAANRYRLIISSLLGFIASSLIIYISWQHNSQCEIHCEGVVYWGYWLSLGAFAFIPVFLVVVFIRWSRWANIIGLPLVALFFYFAYDTLAQPDIGQAIIREQGMPYIVALYGSAVFVLVGLLAGNYLYKLKTVRNA